MAATATRQHTALGSSPSELKHLEKQIQKESKTEASQVKHTLKDVASTEKAAAKAQKDVNKAEKRNEKLSKGEAAAEAALNKATHKHDTAVTELTNSDRELKLKQQHDVKVHAELEKKKAQAERALEGQKAHEEAREAKLNEIKEARASQS